LLSLSVDAVADGVRFPPVNIFEEIKSAWSSVRRQIRYQLSEKRGLNHEYVALVAGSDHWSTPHLHVLIWIDGEIDQSALRPAVLAFIESCEFAPSDGSNDPTDAISIRGPGERELAVDSVRQDMIEERGAATAGAHYVAAQAPHISSPEEATDSELLHGAIAVAAPSRAVHFSRGCWALGDGETPPEGSQIIDYSDLKSQNDSDPSPEQEPPPRARTPRSRGAVAGPPPLSPSRTRAPAPSAGKSGFSPGFSLSRRGPPPPGAGATRYKKTRSNSFSERNL
jgi:hypothetical protein